MKPSKDLDPKDELGLRKEEYFDASANMRHYSNIWAAQLTLFFAANTGLISVISTSEKNVSALEILGLLCTLAFLMMKRRSEQYYHTYRTRAVELERYLGFSQHTSRPDTSSSGSLLTSGNAIYVLYFLASVFWIGMLFNLIELNA